VRVVSDEPSSPPAAPAPEIEELAPGEPLPEEEAAPGEAADPSALLAQSLEAFESAEAFWQRGAFEDAFAALDRAYELMAAVPANGDPLAAQEKENLRHLISRRVVEIHASRQTAVGDPNGSIRVVLNDDVRREIASFQGPERDFFLESYRRSGLYRPMILDQLRAAGLPEQLSWLPLVESGFKSRALSHARALGLWQFIPSTGLRYGLERSAWVDERMDPEKATAGAIGYLTDLHDLFGDWMTALAGYNCGEHAVLREINNQRVSYFDRFWDLYDRLPRETRRYVPRFLAVLEILEHPAGYGFDLPEPLPALDYETLELAREADLAALDRALGQAAGTLAQLNPELRNGATPPEAYPLKVPRGAGGTLLAALDTLPAWEPPVPTPAVHRVRRGETLSAIASRYRTSIGSIMEMNRLRSANRIWPGQQLQVPGGGPGAGSASAGGTAAAASSSPPAEVHHRVRSGDSLWVLASRYGTTVDRIRRDNGLSGSLLRPGQALVVRPGAASGATYVVRRGDTLAAIARRERVGLSRLLAANDLRTHSTIYPGQRLTIPR
jgi:membrane-bound lytic murein transglycosylase D